MSRTSLALTPAASGFPPLAKVLKSRDVEDPVNLWVHRPIAYAFCWLVYRTSITPNQVTVLAVALGLAAAACWVDGSSNAMILGGALLWMSAIMDGADGILARAKNMQSPFGRALDGTADMVVALCTTGACVYHLIVTGEPRWMLLLAGAATVGTVLQLNLYDFYKELHLRMTRLDRGGEGNSAEEVTRLKQSSEVARGSWYTRLSMAIYADYAHTQESLVRRTNPAALPLLTTGARTEASAELYRKTNRMPMRIWMAVSLAPHSYLFAIFAMFDRLDLYVWVRVTLMTGLTVSGLWLQRSATARTVSAFRARGWL